MQILIKYLFEIKVLTLVQENKDLVHITSPKTQKSHKTDFGNKLNISLKKFQGNNFHNIENCTKTQILKTQVQNDFYNKGDRSSALIFHEWNKNCFIFIFYHQQYNI